MERWFLKCRSCKKPWAVDVPDSRHITGYVFHVSNPQLRDTSYGLCPFCGDAPTADERRLAKRSHKVMGKVSRNHLVNFMFAPPCDGRCTNARGPNCDCQCGGKNHGSQRLIETQINAGKVPL